VLTLLPALLPALVLVLILVLILVPMLYDDASYILLSGITPIMYDVLPSSPLSEEQ
jgi:hypothetical protein